MPSRYTKGTVALVGIEPTSTAILSHVGNALPYRGDYRPPRTITGRARSSASATSARSPFSEVHPTSGLWTCAESYMRSLFRVASSVFTVPIL